MPHVLTTACPDDLHDIRYIAVVAIICSTALRNTNAVKAITTLQTPGCRAAKSAGQSHVASHDTERSRSRAVPCRAVLQWRSEDTVSPGRIPVVKR